MKIVCINLKSNTGGNVALGGRECGGANAEERIQENGLLSFAVEEDALLDEGRREGGGVGALAFTRTDCLVRDEPVIAPTPQVGTFSVFPSPDIGFVSVGNSARAAIQDDRSGFRKMEDEFMAVIDEALGVDRFEMARSNCLFLPRFNGNGLYPVECILKLEEVVGGQGEE